MGALRRRPLTKRLPTHPRESSEITLDSKMLTSIKVDTIGEGAAAGQLTVAGKVQFDEDRVARVLAPLSGQVVDLAVKLGDAVRKGQTVCVLSSRDAAAAAGEHIESRKDLELAEKNASMTEDLFEHEAASKMALQQAQNDLAKARARVARTEEALRVLGVAVQDDLARFNGRVPIRAPIPGVVIERRVTNGQFAPADGTPLLTVANLDTVWVIGDLFERDLRFVQRGQPAIVTTSAYPGERFEGKVNYISESIDPASRTAKVRVSVAEPRRPAEARNVRRGRADGGRRRARAHRSGRRDLHRRRAQLRLRGVRPRPLRRGEPWRWPPARVPAAGFSPVFASATASS